MDARVALLAALIALVPLLTRPPTPAVLITYAVLLVALALLGRRLRSLLRGLVPVLWLALGFVALALLFPLSDETRGEALLRGATSAMRLVEVVALGTLLSLAVPPPRLAVALEWLLWPLRALRVDVASLGLLTMLALRFVPLLAAEVQTTERALTLRGVRFAATPVGQVRRLTTLAVPVVGRLLAAADDLGAALVSRGYDLRRDVRPVLPSPTARDIAFFLTVVGLSVALLVLPWPAGAL